MPSIPRCGIISVLDAAAEIEDSKLDSDVNTEHSRWEPPDEGWVEHRVQKSDR